MIDIDFGNFDISNARNIIVENGLVILRNSNFSIEQYEVFVSQIGKPLVTERHVLNAMKTVQEVSNNGLFGDTDVHWHNDWSYGRGDYFGTALYNVCNADLSDTWFQDMSKLPKDYYQNFTDKKGYYLPPQQFSYCFTDRQHHMILKQRICRDFVFDHPVTGEPVLYCSPGTLQQPHPDISSVISYSDTHAYIHKWKPRDLLLWDNLKMMHKRQSFVGQRLLWRIQFILK
jgi:alpha-ketoglutarate-dependent taurine dioxygenase